MHADDERRGCGMRNLYECGFGGDNDSGGGGSFCGNAAGCYVHGIFDSAEVSSRLVRALYQRRGLNYSGEAVDRRKYRDMQLDLLSDNVRKNLDMELICRIIEEGV